MLFCSMLCNVIATNAGLTCLHLSQDSAGLALYQPGSQKWITAAIFFRLKVGGGWQVSVVAPTWYHWSTPLSCWPEVVPRPTASPGPARSPSSSGSLEPSACVCRSIVKSSSFSYRSPRASGLDADFSCLCAIPGFSFLIALPHPASFITASLADL